MGCDLQQVKDIAIAAHCASHEAKDLLLQKGLRNTIFFSCTESGVILALVKMVKCGDMITGLCGSVVKEVQDSWLTISSHPQWRGILLPLLQHQLLQATPSSFR